jgi:hypothetical protein
MNVRARDIVFAPFALAFALATGTAHAQTIVTASSKGIFPNDGIDDTTKLRTELAALGNNTIFQFDGSGTYELSAIFPKPLLQVKNLSNVSIVATVPNVRLVLNYDRSLTSAFPDVLDVHHCTGFTLAGMDSLHPMIFDTRGANTVNPGNFGLPFLQGQVLNVVAPTSGAPCYADLRVTDPAMFLPVSCMPGCWGAWTFLNASGPVSPPVYPQPIHAQFGGTTVVPLGAAGGGFQDVRVNFTPHTWLQSFSNWSTNDPVVVVLNNSDTYALKVHDCTGSVVLKDLLARHLPGKFVQCGANQDLLVQNVDVTPHAGRLLSTNRDGVNVGGEKLEVRDCNVSNCGDDGIVAQGNSWGIVIPNSYSAANSSFTVGPTTSLYDQPTTCINGQQIALVDSTLSGKLGLGPGTVQFATVSSSSSQTQPNGDIYVTFVFSYPTPGFVALASGSTSLNPSYSYNPSYSVATGLVEDCSVVSNRGVGITVRSLNTEVSHCTISDTRECGIHAGGGMVAAYPWGGAGVPPHLLNIHDCQLTRCGSNPFVCTHGAIEIAIAWNDFPGSGCLCALNPLYSTADTVVLDVSVLSNVIRDFPRAGVFAANVGGLQGIHVQGNTFLNSGPASSCHPEYGYAVAVDTCGMGLVQGNQYLNCAGSFHANLSPNVVFIP